EAVGGAQKPGGQRQVDVRKLPRRQHHYTSTWRLSIIEPRLTTPHPPASGTRKVVEKLPPILQPGSQSKETGPSRRPRPPTSLSGPLEPVPVRPTLFPPVDVPLILEKKEQYGKPGAVKKGTKTTPQDALSNKENPFCVRGSPAPRYSFPVVLPPLPSREEYPNVYLDEAVGGAQKPGGQRQVDVRKLPRRQHHYTSTWRLSIIEPRLTTPHPPASGTRKVVEKLPPILQPGSQSKETGPSRRPRPPTSLSGPLEPVPVRPTLFPPVDVPLHSAALNAAEGSFWGCTTNAPERAKILEKKEQYGKPGAVKKGTKTTPQDALSNKENPFCVRGSPAPRYSFPVVLPPLPSREEYPNVYLGKPPEKPRGRCEEAPTTSTPLHIDLEAQYHRASTYNTSSTGQRDTKGGGETSTNSPAGVSVQGDRTIKETPASHLPVWPTGAGTSAANPLPPCRRAIGRKTKPWLQGAQRVAPTAAGSSAGGQPAGIPGDLRELPGPLQHSAALNAAEGSFWGCTTNAPERAKILEKKEQYGKPGAVKKGTKTTPQDALSNKENPFCVRGSPAPRYSFPVVLPPLPSREEYPNVYLGKPPEKPRDEAVGGAQKPGGQRQVDVRKLPRRQHHYTSTWRLSIIEPRLTTPHPPASGTRKVVEKLPPILQPGSQSKETGPSRRPRPPTSLSGPLEPVPVRPTLFPPVDVPLILEKKEQYGKPGAVKKGTKTTPQDALSNKENPFCVRGSPAPRYSFPVVLPPLPSREEYPNVYLDEAVGGAQKPGGQRQVDVRKLPRRQHHYTSTWRLSIIEPRLTTPHPPASGTRKVVEKLPPILQPGSQSKETGPSRRPRPPTSLSGPLEPVPVRPTLFPPVDVPLILEKKEQYGKPGAVKKGTKTTPQDALSNKENPFCVRGSPAPRYSFPVVLPPLPSREEYPNVYLDEAVGGAQKPGGQRQVDVRKLPRRQHHYTSTWRLSIIEPRLTTPHPPASGTRKVVEKLPPILQPGSQSKETGPSRRPRPPTSLSGPLEPVPVRPTLFPPVDVPLILEKKEQYGKPGAVKKGTKTTPQDALSNKENPFCVRGSPAPRYSFPVVLPPLPSREEYPNVYLDEAVGGAQKPGGQRQVDVRKLPRRQHHYTSTWRLSIIEPRLTTPHPPASGTRKVVEKLPPILQPGSQSKETGPSRRPRPPTSLSGPLEPVPVRPTLFPPVDVPLILEKKEQYGKPGAVKKGTKTTPQDALSNKENPFCVRGSPAPRYSFPVVLPPLPSREEYPNVYLDEAAGAQKPGGSKRQVDVRKLPRRHHQYTSTWRLSIIEPLPTMPQPPGSGIRKVVSSRSQLLYHDQCLP
ncbi:UNVERIFIED_CONTAM: hypothetical protein K2H54_054110, partial [Gekko kuhli]